MKIMSLLLIAIGIVFLVVGTVYPLVILTVDTTPPVFGVTVPANGAVYVSLATITASGVIDSESGVKTVTCSIDGGATWSLTIAGGVGNYKYDLLTVLTTAGTHTFNFIATNNAGLTAVISGSFSIYTGLTGTWYVNDVAITSTSQTVYATSATVSFKFTKTAGVADTSITCTVEEPSLAAGTSKLLTLTNSATSTWTGSYTFALGTHTLNLKATDGTQTITMSVIGLQVGSGGFEMSMQMILWIVGAVFIAAGVGVEIVKPKGLPLEGKLKI